MSENKEFEPTKRKLDKCRKEGQVLKSRQLVDIFQVVSLVAALYLFGPSGLVSFGLLLEYCLNQSSSDYLACSRVGAQLGLRFTLICLIFAGLSSIIVEALQVRPRFDAAPPVFRAESLNPTAGLKKIFRGLAMSWQQMLSLMILGFSFFCLLAQAIQYLADSFWRTPREVFAAALGQVNSALFYLLLGAGVIAAMDFLLQLRRYRREVMMTREELRRDMREDEGDPNLRAQRRGLSRQLTYGELVERVRNSKVLVVQSRVSD